MSWFRVDDKSAFHAKVVTAGNAAWGALCRMGSYSSDHETDGLVVEAIAKAIATCDELAALLKVGLLEQVGPDFQIHDFLDWNPSAAQVQKLRRSRAKAGKQGGSKSQANGRASARPPDRANVEAFAPPLAPPLASAFAQTNSEQRERVKGSGDLREGEPGESATAELPAAPPTSPSVGVPRSGRRALNAADDGAAGFAVGAWRLGVESVTGVRYSASAPGAERTLATAINAHCPQGSDPCDFARTSATDFARRQVEAGAEISPFGYANWLNSGKPARASRGAPSGPVATADDPSRRKLAPLAAGPPMPMPAELRRSS